MSDTRPPLAAGPIERAFRFLKSASLRSIGEADGLDVAEGDGASCANKIEIAKIQTSKVQQRTIRVIMRLLSSRCTVIGQGRRLRWQAEHLPHTPAVCD